MFATTHPRAAEARRRRANARLAADALRRQEVAATMARIAQAAREKRERESDRAATERLLKAIFWDEHDVAHADEDALAELEDEQPGTLAYAYERNPFTGKCTKIVQVTR